MNHKNSVDKRKMSQTMEKEEIRDAIMQLKTEEDIEEMAEEYDIDNIQAHAEEIEPLTTEELISKNKAMEMIHMFLQQENMELKKSYQELSKENQALKKVLKDDFQSNYRYIKKDYWRCMLRFLWDDE